jgi:putative membrane protein
MIHGYSDHAANERTFLACVRTGIAVIAFGFVIEKFNLFVLTIASSTSAEVAHRLQFERLSGPLWRYGGLALIIGGLALIVAATARFVRTGQQRTRRADLIGSAGAVCRRSRHLSRAWLIPRCFV